VLTDGYGIGLVGQRGLIDAPLIERNHVSTAGAFPWAEGIFLGGNVSNARVSSNRIDGAGAFGIDLFAFEPGQSAESNALLGNNLTQFAAAVADIFLDAVVGRAGTVIDLGTDNRITGISKIGLGPQIGSRIRRHVALPDRE
jgi:hypothetical protein